MKSRKKWFILTETILLCLVVLCIFLMMSDGEIKKTGHVSVILQNSSDDRWTALKNGILMASKDMNNRISFVSTEGVLSTEEEEKLIRQEIGNGADALIVQPSADEDALRMLMEVSKNTPLILVDAPFKDEEDKLLLSYVGPDNYALGKALAGEIVESYKGNIRGKRLGIILGEKGLLSDVMRVKGLEEGLRGSGIVISWKYCSADEDGTLQDQSRVDITAAVDDRGVIIASECVRDRNLHGAVVYGIGSSEKSLYYLGMGLTERLIVPDEFDEGYQCLSEIQRKSGVTFAELNSKTIDYTVVDKKTLFDEENEKILFILSQ